MSLEYYGWNMVPFLSGRRIAIDVIRNESTYRSVEELAELTDLPPDEFLKQLDAWASSPGLWWGVSVDREAGTISVAGRGVVAR